MNTFGELDKNRTVAKFAIVRCEELRVVERTTEGGKNEK